MDPNFDTVFFKELKKFNDEIIFLLEEDHENSDSYNLIKKNFYERLKLDFVNFLNPKLDFHAIFGPLVVVEEENHEEEGEYIGHRRILEII